MRNLLLLIFLSTSLTINSQDLEKIFDKKPFTYSGSISARAGYNYIEGINARTAPSVYGLNARLKFSIHGIDMPVYFSMRNNGFRYGSNLPRLKISPKYKWASMQIGDVYTKFNPYVLDNRNMRGASLRLTPGKFRFEALYGRIKELTSYRDTLLVGRIDTDVYNRKLVGLGLGLGTTRNHFDLYLIKAWDDRETAYYNQRNTTPKSNSIVGSKTRFRFGKMFSLTSNLGISILTQNLDSAGKNETLLSNGFVGNIAEVNETSNLNFGGDAGVNFRYRNLGLTWQTRYVQAHYQPLSVAYIQTDVLDNTLSASLGLLKNKIFLNGRIGTRSDNLSKNDAITNKRFIYSLVSRIKLSKSITSNIVHNNFSNQLQARTVSISDLYTYSVNNQTTNLSILYNDLSKDGFTASISLGRSAFSTITQEAEVDQSYQNLFSRGDFGYQWVNQNTSVKIGFAHNTYERVGYQTNTLTTNIMAEKTWLDDRLNTSIRSGYTLIDEVDLREGTNLINQLTIRYNLAEKSNLSISTVHIRRSSYINPTFTELRSSLAYGYKF